MKKLLLVAILMLALVLTVAACKTEPGTTETTAGETTAAPAPVDSTAAPDADTTAEPPADTTAEPPADTTAEPPVDTTAEPVTTEVVTADPMEPVNVFKADDIKTLTGMNGVTSAEVVDDVLHIVPATADPYWYPFAGVDGARYVVVRYRTADATGADIQFYIGSTGTAPADDSSMLRQPAIVDGEWHLAIFDTQSLIDAGIYNGSFVSYFRFDPLEAGYILDENGQPQKPDGQNYLRYELPAGCSIDVDYIGFFHSVEAAEAYDYKLQNSPLVLGDAAFIASQAPAGSVMSVGEVTTEFDRTFVRLGSTGADPWFTLLSGANLKANYLAVSYRTNSDSEGEFFVGSGANPQGGVDEAKFDWNEDGSWHLLVLDLAAVEGLTSITDGIVNYLRLDIFTDGGAEGEYVDVEYIGFFKSVKAAENYYNDLHPDVAWDSDIGKTLVTHQSFDELRFLAAGEKIGEAFAPGASAGWNKVATVGFDVDTLHYHGWVGVKGELGEFGYAIDGGEYVFSADFTVAAEQGVIDAAASTGADNASRFGIMVPVADLAGEHTVTTVYKNAAGYVVELVEFTLIRKNADSVLDMATFEGQAGYMANFEAAGYTAPCYKFGYGTVLALGEMDLSKYSAVKITYGCDGGDGTASAFENASSLAIGLKSAATSFGQETTDNFDDAIAYTDMVFSTSGWAGGAREAVVDLSDVDYNGNVWVALHNPAGTEIVVSAVVFVGSSEAPAAANEIAVEITDNYGWFDVVEFTATATGNYTFNLPAGMGAWDVDKCDNEPWSSAPYVDFNENESGASFTIGLTEGETTSFYIAHTAKGKYVITFEFAEGEVGGDEDGDDPVAPAETVLAVGENTIVVTDAILTEGGVTYTMTVTEAGDYQFKGDFMVNILDANGTMVGRGMASLEAGEYTIQLGTMLISAAGEYPLTVVYTAPVAE